MKFPKIKAIKLSSALVLSILGFTTTNVFAHVKLESAVPAINATITTQPKNITLNFSNSVMLMDVKLMNANHQMVPLNYQVNHDFKKSFNIALPKVQGGTYTVGWNTLGSDGHSMNGEYSFTIK